MLVASQPPIHAAQSPFQQAELRKRIFITSLLRTPQSCTEAVGWAGVSSEARGPSRSPADLGSQRPLAAASVQLAVTFPQAHDTGSLLLPVSDLKTLFKKKNIMSLSLTTSV